MEVATSSPKQSIQEDNHIIERNRNRVKKQEIQSVIAKAMELRSLHATLMQQANNSNSPSHLRFPSPSPSAQHNNPQFSAQDYPVFTPSNEDEPAVHGYQHFQMESGNNYDECVVLGGVHEDESNLSRKANASSRKGFNCDLVNLETLAEDSYTNNPTIMFSASSPHGAADFSKSRRSSLSEFRSVSSYNNRCNNPALIRPDSGSNKKNSNNLVVPLTDIHSSVHSQPKTNRGGMMNLLRLFPRLNKKKNNKHMNSPNNRTDPDDVSQSFKDFGGVLSIEALKKEILEANEKRDTALTQVAEMRSSIGELSQKLEYLEKYCEDLKKALKQATVQVNNSHHHHHHHIEKKLERSLDYHIEKDEIAMMPVSEEVMIEGFIQIVSEARLSVKQFCKTLVEQIEQTDNSLMDSLNMLLLPYKLSLEQKLSKAVFYHLEAIVNQYLYQDFENCVFQNNGTPKFLDPQRERESQFSSFVSLRNLSWNEVLRKGTKYYSEEFSKFCDQKMSYIIAAMNWTRPWPEQLLQAFFVTAKCIWLLHLLAFSFNPPLGIIRVDENRSYDPQFMEDLATDKQKSNNSSRIKIMVMPGFYVLDRVLRCQVLCRYKTVK